MKTLSPKRTTELRQTNRQVVLRLLTLEGAMSRVELGQKTGLSLGTITNVTSQLLEQGILRETGTEESEGGRPRSILGVNPQYGFLVGVDLGETHVQLELFDFVLTRRNSVRCPILPSQNTPEAYIQTIATGMTELLSDAGVLPGDILGVGIGVPGVVEHNGPVSISAPMWKWNSIAFPSMLEKAIALPVYVDNGAKAMSLAEFWFGAGRGAQDVVVALIGTGVGAGVITKGTLYRGATNSAGEWGHTNIALDGRPCRCGSRGCLEAYIGAPGILATLSELNGAPIAANDQIEQIQSLVGAAAQGDPAARQTLAETARYLGAGIANLVNLFNPERVVMGGWAGLLMGEAILPEVRAQVQRYALPASLAHLEISLCQFGQDAICTGAACLVIQEVLASNQKFTRPQPSQP